MRQAGGIIAIVAGILAVLAAGFTLVVGGLGSALEVDGAGTAVVLGGVGALFSFLAIVLGAIMLAVERRLVAVLTILCAIGGAVLSGNAVATFMILALIGGVLALFDRKKPARRQADRQTFLR